MYNNLHFRFTYVLPKSSEVEKYGLAPSTIQQLLNNVSNIQLQNDISSLLNFHLRWKEVDIVPYLFANTGERNRMMDITFPIIFENYYILFAKSEESSVLNIAKPFQYEVNIQKTQLLTNWTGYRFRSGWRLRPPLPFY